MWNSRKRRNNLGWAIRKNLSARHLRPKRRVFWSEYSKYWNRRRYIRKSIFSSHRINILLNTFFDIFQIIIIIIFAFWNNWDRVSLIKQNKFEICLTYFLIYAVKLISDFGYLLIVERYIISVQNHLKWTRKLEIAIHQRYDIETQFLHINSDM